MSKQKSTYKILFHNQGKLYELYAREVSHHDMYGFVEVSDIIFGEHSAVLVNPAEEKLKAEFNGVKRTYIPLHSVVRIDEVIKEGVAKIVGESDAQGKITPFPMPMVKPGDDSK